MLKAHRYSPAGTGFRNQVRASFSANTPFLPGKTFALAPQIGKQKSLPYGFPDS
jgi:hypothetical protein